MKEWTGEAAWQKTPCVRCTRFHPSNCPDCHQGDPPCADHVCAWPEECGSEPPRELTDSQGVRWMVGDCWCTLDEGHDGECVCEPCRDRFGAPGWTAEPVG